MIVMDDFDRLTKEVARLEREKAKAEGARSELLKRLKKEFGIETIEEAEALLEKLKLKELASFRKYNKARDTFDKKWKKREQKT